MHTTKTLQTSFGKARSYSSLRDDGIAFRLYFGIQWQVSQARELLDTFGHKVYHLQVHSFSLHISEKARKIASICAMHLLTNLMSSRMQSALTWETIL